jgi:hypothetical protein
MNHSDVLLIGVFDPDGREEAFVYSVDAPRNLWIGALCADGSRMGIEFMQYILNEMIEADLFNPGQTFDLANQNGMRMRATIGEFVPARDVSAFQAQTSHVLPVSVEVFDADG